MSYTLLICPHCEAENSPNAKRCTECRGSLKQATKKDVNSATGETKLTEAKKRKTSKEKWLFTGAVLGALAVWVIAVNIYAGSKSDNSIRVSALDTATPTYVTSSQIPDVIEAINHKRTAAGIKTINLSSALSASADKIAADGTSAKQYPVDAGNIRTVMSKSAYAFNSYNSFYHADVTSVEAFMQQTFADSRFSTILLDGTYTDIGIAIQPYPVGSGHSNLLMVLLASPRPASTPAPYRVPTAPLYIPPPVYQPTHCTTQYYSFNQSYNTTCY